MKPCVAQLVREHGLDLRRVELLDQGVGEKHVAQGMKEARHAGVHKESAGVP